VQYSRSIYYDASKKDHVIVDLSRQSSHQCQLIYPRNRAKLRLTFVKGVSMISDIYFVAKITCNYAECRAAI
jgi:hypothetical protein